MPSACRVVTGMPEAGPWRFRQCALLLMAAVLCAAGRTATAASTAESSVSADPAGLNREEDGTNWPSYGRTYSETHASPLTDINAANVRDLGLAAYADLGDDLQGATVPIAVDGIVYVTVGQSRVHAVDARTGRILWVHDPEVAMRAGRKLRYQWGPRGLAYWDHRIYVGTMDGRLIALDSRTGREVWSVVTTQPGDDRYITGAPRVFDGMVIIGHGGADVAPTRGYVTAYDARTGVQRWRFYTVPGDPARGFESKAMAMAARTWKGERWKLGGGGTVWSAITYDPGQDLVYIGTGNGAPHNQKIRSPGGGDNLFLASIVALDARTGAYRWHYQVNPGESWDFNCAMDITMATLVIDGVPRKVLLHAPKDGFFYVIDRTDGKLISAAQFADQVTWATRIDIASGRPVETPAARDWPTVMWPGSIGAHSWAPMAYNSQTGLVYIPTIELPGSYDDTGIDPLTWAYQPGQWNVGYRMGTGPVPANAGSSYLQAYDPVRQRRVWKVPLPGAWPGGVMTTAGNLVFGGRPDGVFAAYAADSGKLLWSFDAGLGISGAPITFRAAGRQYVAVVAGWGGVGAAFFGPLSNFGWQSRLKRNHLYLFALGGHEQPPPQAAPLATVPIDDPNLKLDPALVQSGGDLYAHTCVACHGGGAFAAGLAPDLRASGVAMDARAFAQAVTAGTMLRRGMPKYDELSAEQVESLRQFIRARAREDLSGLRPALLPSGSEK